MADNFSPPSPPSSPVAGEAFPVDPVTEENVQNLLATFENWLKIPVGAVRTFECQNLDRAVYENWNQITDIFKNHYADVGRSLVSDVITYGNRTQKKARMMVLMKKDAR